MADHDDTLPLLILPKGTQVVSRVELRAKDSRVLCPRGAVGVIVESPADAEHSYRVRLPDGTEVALKRSEIAVRKQYQSSGIEEAGAALADHDLQKYVIYRCVVGSRAYGLDHEDSDKDVRGIYLPAAERHWSLYSVPPQIEYPETEECYWELQKFLVLALKANPNVLECLYTPLVEFATPLAREVLDQRTIFLSKLVYQTYNGYVLSQFKRMEQTLRNQGAIKWKHAMHLIRLLLAGITVLRDGVVPVRVPDEHRERLLAIRHGVLPWGEVDRWRMDLHKEFDQAYATTSLPDRPDHDRANVILIRGRRAALEAGR